MTIEDQVDLINQSVGEFADCVKSLSHEAFLQKIDQWSPRDILAHLVGWNLFTIDGCEQIRNAEIPFYFDDPGEDFSRINAILVQNHPSRDRQKLLDELHSSAQALIRYLQSLDPADWDRDFGLRFEGWPVTIQSSVDAIMQDYGNHRAQINAWVESLGGANEDGPKAE